MKLKSFAVACSFLFCAALFTSACKSLKPAASETVNLYTTSQYENIIINDNDKTVKMYNSQKKLILSFKYRQPLNEEQIQKLSNIYSGFGLFGVMNFIAAEPTLNRMTFFNSKEEKSAEIKKIQLNAAPGESVLEITCFLESQLLNKVYGIMPGDFKIVVQHNAGAESNFALEFAQIHIADDGPKNLYYIGNDYLTNIIGRVLGSKEKRTSFKGSIAMRTRTIGKKQDGKNEIYFIDFSDGEPVSGMIIEQIGADSFNTIGHIFTFRQKPITDSDTQYIRMRNDGQKDWITAERKSLYHIIDVPDMQRNSVLDSYYSALTSASYLEIDDHQNLYYGKEKVNARWLEILSTYQYATTIDH